MAIFARQDTRFNAGLLSAGGAQAISRPSSEATTTPAERILLLTTVLILPLELHIPTVAGFSSQFLMFAVLAGYVAINRLRCLDGIWMHPVFVAAYVFIGVSVALEFASPFSSYEVIGRFALMIAGALVVASLCRDRSALKVLLYGYIAAALWLGALLIITTYGTLSGVVATNFEQASQVREQVFTDAPVKANLNSMAFNCVQGGIVALAFALGSASVRGRNFFAVIGILSLVASSLPMSRGAIVNAVVSYGAVLKANGMRQGKVWLLTGLLAASAFFFVPHAMWSRMEFITEEGQKESRAVLYESAIQHAEDYLFTGVGVGNYLNKWGIEHGFGRRDGSGNIRVYASHNTFLQVLIYYGAIGLLPFFVVIWLAYRCLPQTFGTDALTLGMLGIAVSLLLLMPFTSEFYYKGYSLGLGMLVAYQRWLTPISVVVPQHTDKVPTLQLALPDND
jgi:hypothetical protein